LPPSGSAYLTCIQNIIIIIIINGSNIPGNHEVKELQKTAILGTAHILRKVLMLNYSRFNNETNDISTMNSNNRIAATLYSIGT